MMEQDALEKAKERLKSNYSKARSARHGAQLCQPAPAPRPRAAPPRQRDLTREAPTLSPALKAQGWAVKQSRSTGGYYYVHTANGREWSQWEPPVAERRSSPERAAAALFSDEDDDGSASDSEDEMPVSALLARQATANDAAIAQALAGSPAKRSRRVTGGVGGRRHGSKKRREPVVVPAPAEDDDSSSVWSQSSLSDSNPPSPTYESVMESGGIDYESGFLDDENPAPAGRGRGAVKPAWMTRGGGSLGATLDARVDDDFRPLGSRAVLAAAAPAPRPPPQPRAAVATPRPWRNPYAAEAAATNAPAPRGWRNPYAAETASATHVITPEGAAPFGQTPRWAPPTPWGPPAVAPVRTQSEPWRQPTFSPYGPGGYTPAPPVAQGWRPRPREPRPWEVVRELSVPSQHVGLVVGKGGANLDRMRRLYGGVDTRVGDFDEPGSAPPQRRLAFTGRAPDVDKAMADVAGLMRLAMPAPPVDHDADFDGAEFSGDEGETPSVKAGRAAARRTAEPKRSPRGAARGSRSPERAAAAVFDEPAAPAPRSAPAFAPPGSEPTPRPPVENHGLPDSPPPLTADGAVDALYDIIVSQGVDCIDASRLTLDFSAFGGVKALLRGHGGSKLRWVDVSGGRVVVVGAGRSSEEVQQPPPTPSFLNRPAAAPAPDLAPSSTGFSAEAAPKPIPAPPDEKPRHCRICGEAFSVGWSATESLWVLEGCVSATVDDGTTALVHADCRAAAGDVIEAAALIPDPSAPRTVSPRAVSPPPPGAARTINDATVAARTKQILAEDEAIRAEYGAGSLTVRTLRAAVAKALGVEEAVVKKVVRATLMAQIAADTKPPEEDAASAPADADDDWGSASFGMAPAPAPARKSRFDVPAPATAPAAIADVAAPEPDFGARLAARAERFGAHAAPTDQRDRSRRRSRSPDLSRRRDKKRKGGDVYVPPSRRQEHRKRTSYPYGERR